MKIHLTRLKTNLVNQKHMTLFALLWREPLLANGTLELLLTLEETRNRLVRSTLVRTVCSLVKSLYRVNEQMNSEITLSSKVLATGLALELLLLESDRKFPNDLLNALPLTGVKRFEKMPYEQIRTEWTSRWWRLRWLGFLNCNGQIWQPNGLSAWREKKIRISI